MLRRSALRRLLRLPERDARERGDANVEMVLVFPVFAAMVFAIIQGAIWYDAGNVAQAAATVALNEARTYQSTATAGSNAGNTFLADNGANLKSPNVSVARTPTAVTVTVTGHSATIIPGWFGTNISRTVTGPVERWVQ